MIKAVVFDFDGTLTEKNENFWKVIWQRLGYDTGKDSYYRKLYNDFNSGKLTHVEWCNLTCKAFQKGKLNKTIFNEIAGDIRLISGVKEVFENLHNKGVDLHIVSGNIVDAIKNALGDSIKLIDCVKANNFIFNESGDLVAIVGTEYDYMGKSNYIKELCEKKGYKPEEVCFVGNGKNDEFVHLSGCKTICINADDANGKDVGIWHKNLEVNDLRDIEKEL